MTTEVGPVVTPTEMDLDWFNRVLAPPLGDGRLDAVDAQPIGTGQVGENIRFRLTWATDGSAARPASLVGKFPSDNAQSFATAREMGIYAAEVGFYRDLAHTLTVRVPAVHYIGFDPETSRFCLLMEDITPAVQGDQLEGTDVSIAELAVDQALRLHGPTWGRAEELAELSWITMPTTEAVTVRNQIIRSVFDGFATRYSGSLNDADIELGRELMTRLDQLSQAQMPSATDGVSGALCLAHQDFRLDNMLFGTGPHTPAVTVVDWQTCRLGSGPADVAYFCGAGLVPEVRRSNEHTLVNRYIAGLQDAGVDADPEVIWRRYVLGSASGYLMAVLASQIVGATDRGDAMFCVMAQRHATQIRDLGLFDLLDFGTFSRAYSR